MLNRNPDLKLERGYTHAKSYVRLDGSEVLHGDDWKRRKKELWWRGNGRCEWIESGRCGNRMDDPHHIIARSKYRDDRLDNLVGLCRDHHREIDPRKIGGRQ